MLFLATNTAECDLEILHNLFVEWLKLNKFRTRSERSICICKPFAERENCTTGALVCSVCKRNQGKMFRIFRVKNVKQETTIIN